MDVGQLRVASETGSVDFGDYGAGGGTRVVGLYDDPLVLSGEVEKALLTTVKFASKMTSITTTSA